MRHPPAMLTTLNRQRNLSRNGQQPPLLQTMRQHLHRGIVNLMELTTRHSDLKRRIRSIQHRVIDLRLNLGKLAVHRERAGHIGGVQGIVLNTGIQQQQLALIHGAVIANPVQNRRIIPAGCNRVIAQVVAVGTCHREKRGLHHALTTMMRHRLRQLTHNLLEALHRHINRTLQVLNLDLVLNQAGLRKRHRQLRIELIGFLQRNARVVPGSINQRINRRINLTHQPDTHPTQILGPGVLRNRNLKLRKVLRPHTVTLRKLLKRGARTNPELAIARIRIKLRGITASQRTEIQGHLMVRAVIAGALLHRLKNQHGVSLMINTQPGLVRKRRMRAETVIAIVRTNLQRPRGQNQTLTRELLGNLLTALRRKIGNALACIAIISSGLPIRCDELLKS